MNGMGININANMGGMNVGGVINMNGGSQMGMQQGMNGNYIINIAFNQNQMANKQVFHSYNPNSQYGQQQMLVDPFGWSQVPSYGNSP
jgi:hypothetical protein